MRERGQVWRWYDSSGLYYHCVLLHPSGFDELNIDTWEVLDLDSDDAGRIAVAYFHANIPNGARWTRIT